MKKLITKPHLFFFGLIPVFIILGFLKNHAFINIAFGYISFDVSLSTLCYVSAIFFSLIGINYFSITLADKKLKKGLTITHILLQLISLIPFLTILATVNNTENSSSNSQLILTKYALFISIGFILFLVSIVVHLINFFTSLFLKTT